MTNRSRESAPGRSSPNARGDARTSSLPMNRPVGPATFGERATCFLGGWIAPNAKGFYWALDGTYSSNWHDRYLAPSLRKGNPTTLDLKPALLKQPDRFGVGDFFFFENAM